MTVGMSSSHPPGFPNSTGGATAGGVPVFSTLAAVSSETLSTDQGGANIINLYYLDLPTDTTFDTLDILLSANGSGGTLQDLGIYALNLADLSACPLMANVGPIGPQSGAPDADSLPINQGSITLPAGAYIFATTANANSGGLSLYFGEPFAIHQMYTTTTPSSGGTLPPTIDVTIIPGQPFGTQPIFPLIQLNAS